MKLGEHYLPAKRNPMTAVIDWFRGFSRDDVDQRFDDACDLARFGFDAAVKEVESIVRLAPNKRRFRSILSIFYHGAADERIGLHDFVGPLRELERISLSGPQGVHKAEEILSCILPDDLGTEPSQATNSLSHFNLDKALDGALDLYDKSIRLTPNNPDSYLARARAFHELADHVLMAFGIFPDYESPHSREPQAETFGTGNACLGTVKWPEVQKPPDLNAKVLWLYSHAESDYTSALKLDLTNAETHLNMSHVQRQQGKVVQADGHRDRALGLLNKAVGADNSDSESYLKRADIFEETGEFALAIADFERVLTLSTSESQLSSVKSRIEKLKAEANR